MGLVDNLIPDGVGADLFDVAKRHALKQGGIEASFFDLLKDINETGEQVYSMDGMGDMVKRLGATVAAHYTLVGAAQLTGLITEGTATAFGGPAGAAASIVLEEAAKAAVKKFLPGWSGEVAYKRGDWVQIDNGVITTDIATKKLGEILLGSMFEDFPDDEDWDSVSRESYSVGFVTEVGEKGDVTVYNFKFGHEQALDEAFVRPAGDQMSAKFDANSQLAAVKTLRLKLDRMEGTPLVNSPVNTDPGTEVYLDGEKYYVVQCIGTAALVENGQGHQVLVDVRKLEPGPSKHTRRHNYRADGSVDDNFYATEGGAALAQGQWVWIQPGAKALAAYANCQAVLACIMFVEGPTCRVASAWHGDTVDEPTYAVVPVNEAVREVLNQWQHFAEFREAAVTGYALRRKAPGNWMPEICLGIGPMGDLLGDIEFPDPPERGEGSASGTIDAVTPGAVGSGRGAALELGEQGEDSLVEELVEGGIPRDTARGLTYGAASVNPDVAAAPVNYAIIAAVVLGAVVVVVYLR